MDFDKDILIKEIVEYVHVNNLYKEGHFILHDDANGESKDSVRNTFDCVGLLARHQFLDGISQALLNILYTGSPNPSITNLTHPSFFLIGIANSGALLAAHMGFLVGLPYAYLVPMQKWEQYTKWEKSIDDIKDTVDGMQIALVIGVNHTGASIREACEIIMDKLKKEKKDIHVVGFLDRETVCENVPSIEASLAKAGFQCEFLMKGYAIDRCTHSGKQDCPYHKKCMEVSAGGGTNENNTARL